MVREKRKRGRPALKADEVKNITYSVRLDKELDDRLNKYTKKNDLAISETVRKALSELFDKDNI